MTPAAALLNEMERRGVEFQADGSRLRYRPVKAVSPEFLSRLRTHKDELLAILRERHGTGDGDITTGSGPGSGVLSPASADSAASPDKLPPWTDPKNAYVRAARAEARRLGVLDDPLPTNPASVGGRWVEGDDLNQLPEKLQGLVVAREGWTAPRWADYLRHRARICDERHRDVAKLYEQAVALLRRGSDGDAD